MFDGRDILDELPHDPKRLTCLIYATVETQKRLSGDTWEKMRQMQRDAILTKLIKDAGFDQLYLDETVEPNGDIRNMAVLVRNDELLAIMEAK